jgi:Heterokaryon incompatibility protein (HET)
MAAAEFFAEAEVDTEEHLEARAKDIDARTLLLQANIRGFLSRQRHIFSTDTRHSVNDRHGEDATSPQTGEGILEAKRHSVQNLPGLGVSNSTDPGKDSQINNLLNIESRHTDATGDLNLRISTKILDLITPTPEELDCKLEQAAKDSTQNSHFPAAPWWTDIPLDYESKNLCTVCSHIKFDTLLHTTDPYMYERPIPLGNLQNISKKTGCACCRLLTHLASILLKTSVESLRYDTAACAVDCHLCDDPEWARCMTRIRQICLRLTLSLPHQKQKVHTFGRIQQILQNSEHPPEQKFNDVRLVKNQIDLDLIKSWIRVCEEEHNSTQLLSNEIHSSLLPTEPPDVHSPSALITESCQPAKLNETSFHLTIIDVREECLVDVLPEVRYVALSYIWGGPQTFQNVLKTRQSLYLPHGVSLINDAIPYTIRDAMRLVALLGEEYLWVDSLCICQDDMDDKMGQIGNMGNIYSQAMLTIVAAYGESAQAGLPGVRPFSRNIIQHTELVQNILLANEILHLDEELLQSYWNTRGWTYQEKELSKRCLIFGGNQVYFQCNRKEFKEDSGFRDVAYAKSRALRIRGETQPIWNSYRRAVVSFTKRTFSFETDVVHAFQGVASLFQPAFKGDFLFGLPETALDAALLWQPYSPTHRRIDNKTGSPLFPSWSWAGWVGKIRYPWSKHLLDDVSRVEWQYTDGVHSQIGFCNSSELRAHKSCRHSTWEHVVPPTRGTPYYYQPEEPNLWCLHPVATKDERHDRILIQPSYHYLTFKAYVATLCISTTHRDFNLDPVASCTPDAHTLCPVSILDNDGFAAGTIYLPGHESTILSNQKYEIVCLSRRRSDYDVRGFPPPTPEDDFKDTPGHVTIYPVGESLQVARMTYDPRRYNMHKPWPLYNVMLIRREKDVAYRVAIGLMHVTAFLQAQPVKKLITLA